MSSSSYGIHSQTQTQMHTQVICIGQSELSTVAFYNIYLMHPTRESQLTNFKLDFRLK